MPSTLSSASFSWLSVPGVAVKTSSDCPWSGSRRSWQWREVHLADLDVDALGLVAEKRFGGRRLYQRLAEWPHDLRGLVGQTVHDPHQPGTHVRGPQLAVGAVR
ncbi:hypothetical protein [Streptomyces antibioticus]|uniref:hypothetical protein n=1 Tax=Streptomyces antibioticus TaxID=1890 RepID=UPI0026BBA03D